MLKIIIFGDCPSKKNSRILTFRGSRPMSFPNKKYSDWHRGASKQLLLAKPSNVVLIDPPIEIDLIFYPSTKRKSDLTNKAESVMDLLVDNGFILDDNWFVVSKINLIFGEVDPKNPRVEIVITEGVARV